MSLIRESKRVKTLHGHFSQGYQSSTNINNLRIPTTREDKVRLGGTTSEICSAVTRRLSLTRHHKNPCFLPTKTSNIMIQIPHSSNILGVTFNTSAMQISSPSREPQEVSVPRSLPFMNTELPRPCASTVCAATPSSLKMCLVSKTVML